MAKWFLFPWQAKNSSSAKFEPIPRFSNSVIDCFVAPYLAYIREAQLDLASLLSFDSVSRDSISDYAKQYLKEHPFLFLVHHAGGHVGPISRDSGRNIIRSKFKLFGARIDQKWDDLSASVLRQMLTFFNMSYFTFLEKTGIMDIGKMLVSEFCLSQSSVADTVRFERELRLFLSH